MSEDSGVELVVREAEARDAGRGIVRLPDGARRTLGVLSGDTVVIEGSRATVAKVWPGGALPEGELRIDGETRSNAGARVGETVVVRPKHVAAAHHVVVAPTDPLSADPESVAATVKRALLDRPVSAGQRVRIDALGEAGEFQVVRTEPSGTVIVGEDTRLEVPTDARAHTELRVGITYEDIGGLGEELEQVRELVELPLTNPEIFQRLGIDPPSGVLLYGPPGTGKTLIARAVAGEANAHFISVSGPEILGKYKGESEERLREIFEEARENAPSIVFFDEIDAIAATRDEGADMESRVVAQLLSLMDGLEARNKVVVIGATNRVDAIDQALRRGGRFDREIEIGVPGKEGRREILEIHTRGVPLATDVPLESYADRTYGFVGADLQALVSEAAMTALRRARAGEVTLAALTVTRADFERALASVEPSAMREYVAEMPDTGFERVGGLEAAKRTLRESVEWPLSHANLFEATNTDPPRGILLWGPPGTGKTLLARAIAHESGVNFIHVAGPELVDKYVGESEKAVRKVFERARQASPAIVFFDEIDAIAARRGEGQHEVTERVVSQLLTELDGVAANPNLVVLAATNRKAAIDPALLRPGRLETHVEVPRPDEAARRAILAVHAADKPLADDVDLDAVAAELSGYTGADIEAIVREASMRAIREAVDAWGVDEADARAAEIRVSRSHFDAAIAHVTATEEG